MPRNIHLHQEDRSDLRLSAVLLVVSLEAQQVVETAALEGLSLVPPRGQLAPEHGARLNQTEASRGRRTRESDAQPSMIR
jgi:hypothetical protein